MTATGRTRPSKSWSFVSKTTLSCVAYPLIPPTSSNRDVGAFTTLKAAYCDHAERLFRRGANTIGKEHFTSPHNAARGKAFTKRNITAAWAASGLFPFNPDRLLRTTPKLPAQLTVPEADEITARFYGSGFDGGEPMMHFWCTPLPEREEDEEDSQETI